MKASDIASHLPGLRRYARALTGDAWAADDLVQDTLERAFTKWRLWNAGTDLRAWLFTVMHNLYLNGRRSARPHLAAVSLDDLEIEPAAPQRSVDAVIDLERCLMQLPDGQRAVLLLVTLEDMGYEEVAEVLGVPVGTVMSRLSRARSRLRELMEGAPVQTVPAASPSASATAGPLRRMK
ncbi:sigma-70 family RNA polymerase sigma factor [Variovorax sp. VNK109]|uniref:sigma-70 family RNA polymerase sigma factor n=1 Tax=Variovorax sp. VNK109 TaxID=3400919 RepID=UPI003C12256B